MQTSLSLSLYTPTPIPTRPHPQEGICSGKLVRGDEEISRGDKKDGLHLGHPVINSKTHYAVALEADECGTFPGHLLRLWPLYTGAGHPCAHQYPWTHTPNLNLNCKPHSNLHPIYLPDLNPNPIILSDLVASR